MKRYAKMLSILLTIAVLSGLAIACGAQPTPETVTKVETVVVEKEKVVTQEVEKVVTKEVEKVVEKEVVKDVNPIIYNSYNGDPEPRRVDEMLVQMFNEQHPETPVQHSIIAHEDFKQAIRAYLVADPAPDVMTWFAGNRARFFIDKGLIMDISDVWESEGWNEDYPKGFQALSTVDGKQYFLPSSWYWWAIFYRKSVFEENGITPPETWDELLATCDALNDKGIIPITIGTKFRWTAAAWFDYINMRLNGPEFHRDLMLGKEKYDDPRVRAVFDKWNELFEHNCFIDNAAAYSWQDALDPFNRGEAAMYLMGQFILDSVAEEVKDDVDFFRFPIIDPNVPIGEDAPTDGFFMSANARNPEGGKKFLAFMGSVEAQTIMVKELGRLPVHTKVDPSLFNPMQLKGIELIKGADLVMQFYDRDTTPEMADAGMNGFMAFWDDPAAIDDILADLEATRQEVFAEE
ncbi:MAG: carbohydrate ABC transporter substrate-binding protein [Chloroflexi bacterium]|nr:MAG: carbohydrate ABC transporter substrate-binding protein [Chloroflexota bacterium]